MNFKTLLTATVLTVAPAITFAQCSSKQHQAMSCGEGTVYDAATMTCVQQASS